MGAAWSDMQFEMYCVYISQKLKKLKEEKSLHSAQLILPTVSYLPPCGLKWISKVVDNMC